MNICLLLILILSLVNSSLANDHTCSREGSRIVRNYFNQTFGPIYEENHLFIPDECIFFSKRDIYSEQELNKIKLTNNKWLCKYCNKTFSSEYYVDVHLSNRHNNTLIQDDQLVCLADYCSIFRCDVLKHVQHSIGLFNYLTDQTIIKPKKNIHEQQLTILRSRCASIINQCIPYNIDHDIRVKMQHEMYAEVCAYLTPNRYYELPNYLKPLIGFSTVFCLTICISMCFIGVGIVKRSAWTFYNHDEDESYKHLSDETISTATALLSKTPASGIIHSSKNPPTTIRHRVRFKSLNEN